MSQRKKPREVSFFLLTRGLWLIVLELTIIHVAWAGDFSYTFFSLGVIWVLGFCMVLLAALIYLSKGILLVLGILLVFGHNALDSYDTVNNDLPGFVWSVFHVPHSFELGKGHTLEVLYCSMPWLGLMILGYLFGRLYRKEVYPIWRKKTLILMGTGCILLFLLLRWGNFYGDYHHWQKQENELFTVLSFINTSKYPPSLLFLLMTIGPALLWLAFAEKLKGKFFDAVTVFGRVPLFYYMLHIFLIHAIAWGIFRAQGHSILGIDIRHSSGIPEGVGVSLGWLYVIWFSVILLLYLPCRWYNQYKSSYNHWWLSYL
jgi:uncharacterized membrane protein